MDTKAVVEAFVGAWNETDDAKRATALEATWATDGSYADPTETIEGRDAIAASIIEFHETRPGARIEIRSGMDAFGGQFRFAWAVVGGDGTVLNEGEDFGHLDPDGRIASITGFFGPLPPR